MVDELLVITGFLDFRHWSIAEVRVETPLYKKMLPYPANRLAFCYHPCGT